MCVPACKTSAPAAAPARDAARLARRHARPAAAAGPDGVARARRPWRPLAPGHAELQGNSNAPGATAGPEPRGTQCHAVPSPAALALAPAPNPRSSRGDNHGGEARREATRYTRYTMHAEKPGEARLEPTCEEGNCSDRGETLHGAKLELRQSDPVRSIPAQGRSKLGTPLSSLAKI